MESLITPADEAETASAVAAAASARTALQIAGGGTRLRAGNAVEASTRLSLARLSGVTLYEPAALTIAALAGTPVAEVEAALAEQGQHLPFEPADWRGLLGSTGESTIGGVAMTAAAGPRRIQAGSVRDAAIGVRFVDGSGTIVKNGGRVMKNVTGYDLVKLMCGSWGTLGVLTEIVFKVLPKPETSATVLLHGLDDARAIEALSAALGSPFDVTGAAHLPGDGGRTMARIEGFADSVDYRARELARALAAFGEARILGPDETVAAWKSVRDVEAFAARPGVVWRLSMRPSRAADAVALIGRTLAHEAIYDWGGGLVWLLAPEEGDGGASLVRAAVAAAGGHATLVRAGVAIRRAVPAFQPQPAPLAAVSEGIRAKFDPGRILNPGRMDHGAARAAA